MTDFEQCIYCLLIPVVYVLTYIAGKYDILRLIILMLEGKVKEYNDKDNIIDLRPFDQYCHEVCKKYGISESHLSCYMTWYADPAHSCANCPRRELCDRMHEEGVDCDE